MGLIKYVGKLPPFLKRIWKKKEALHNFFKFPFKKSELKSSTNHFENPFPSSCLKTQFPSLALLGGLAISYQKSWEGMPYPSSKVNADFLA